MLAATIAAQPDSVLNREGRQHIAGIRPAAQNIDQYHIRRDHPGFFSGDRTAGFGGTRALT
ncbi:MAG: hypothetical protein IPK52_22460 [Chloroflexi bacterium]|nr:hypothetical protein [Chloroflexota bacterium]